VSNNTTNIGHTEKSAFFAIGTTVKKLVITVVPPISGSWKKATGEQRHIMVSTIVNNK
jgi:hypothetical protein